jgi:hypothetical protein
MVFIQIYVFGTDPKAEESTVPYMLQNKAKMVNIAKHTY